MEKDIDQIRRRLKRNKIAIYAIIAFLIILSAGLILITQNLTSEQAMTYQPRAAEETTFQSVDTDKKSCFEGFWWASHERICYDTTPPIIGDIYYYACDPTKGTGAANVTACRFRCNSDDENEPWKELTGYSSAENLLIDCQNAFMRMCPCNNGETTYRWRPCTILVPDEDPYNCPPKPSPTPCEGSCFQAASPYPFITRILSPTPLVPSPTNTIPTARMGGPSPTPRPTDPVPTARATRPPLQYSP